MPVMSRINSDEVLARLLASVADEPMGFDPWLLRTPLLMLLLLSSEPLAFKLG